MTVKSFGVDKPLPFLLSHFYQISRFWRENKAESETIVLFFFRCPQPRMATIAGRHSLCCSVQDRRGRRQLYYRRESDCSVNPVWTSVDVLRGEIASNNSIVPTLASCSSRSSSGNNQPMDRQLPTDERQLLRPFHSASCCVLWAGENLFLKGH